MTSSSCLRGHHRRRGLLLLAVAASVLTVATSPVPPSSPSANSSTFRSNVAALLDGLPSAAAVTGFATLSHGTGADDHTFVRGDVAPADCASYLRSAAAGIVSRCNGSSLRATVWYDKCFISYGDTNASTGYEDTFRQILCNTRKSTFATRRTYGGPFLR